MKAHETASAPIPFRIFVQIRKRSPFSRKMKSGAGAGSQPCSNSLGCMSLCMNDKHTECGSSSSSPLLSTKGVGILSLSLSPLGLYDLNAGWRLVMSSPVKTPPAVFHYGGHKRSPIQCQSFLAWKYARMIFPPFMLYALSRLRSRANLHPRYLVDFKR